MKQPKRPRRRHSPTQTLTGVLRANSRGFGFVEVDAHPDFFVPAPLMAGLIDADRVDIDVADGNVIAIRLDRRNRGTVYGRVIDGTFRVDPGVGQLSFPLAGSYSADEIISVRLKGDGGELHRRHGSLTNPVTVARVVLDRHQIPFGRPRPAEMEASSQPTRRAGTPGVLRRDLRDQLVVTIDAPHSRDLDDAVAAEVDRDGFIRVWVHISDVAEVVTPGSAIDRAAFEVPTSVYLPDFVRPMLPESFAHDRLSLLPGVERDVVSVEMRIAPSGQISSVDVYESRIVSRTRLSYSTVAQLLDGTRGPDLVTQPGEDVSNPIVDLVGWLWAAATRLGQHRHSRGGVDAFRVDSTPGQDRKEDNAHLLIERLMVGANESVALWLNERGVPALYRVHEPIDAESAAELERVADAFGVKAHLGRPVTPQAFAAFASSLNPTRSAGVWDAVLGLLGRARYSVDAIGHFGLGAPYYLHFTSPIRRYADLRVHRLVKSYLRGNRNLGELRPELVGVADAINPVIRRADLAMRDGDRSAALAAVTLTAAAVNGVITSLNAKGLSVLTSLTHVPVSVNNRTLPVGSRFDQARRTVTLPDGKVLAVGTRADVMVESVDILAGRIEGRVRVDSDGRSGSANRRRPAPSGTRRDDQPKSAAPATRRRSRRKRDGRRNADAVAAQTVNI